MTTATTTATTATAVTGTTPASNLATAGSTPGARVSAAGAYNPGDGPWEAATPQAPLPYLTGLATVPPVTSLNLTLESKNPAVHPLPALMAPVHGIAEWIEYSPARRRWAMVVVVALVMTVQAIAIAPLAASRSLAHQLGTTDVGLGIVLGCYFAGAAFSAPAWWWLAHNVSRKAAMLGGLGLLAIASWAGLAATSLTGYSLVRAAQGLASGGLAIIDLAVVDDMFPPDACPRKHGLADSGSLVGRCVGLVAGAALVSLPPDHRYLFAVEGGVAVLALLATAALVPATRSKAVHASEPSPWWRPWAELTADGPRMLVWSLAFALPLAVFDTLAFRAGYSLTVDHGYTPLAASGVLAAGGAAVVLGLALSHLATAALIAAPSAGGRLRPALRLALPLVVSLIVLLPLFAVLFGLGRSAAPVWLALALAAFGLVVGGLRVPSLSLQLVGLDADAVYALASSGTSIVNALTAVLLATAPSVEAALDGPNGGLLLEPAVPYAVALGVCGIGALVAVFVPGLPARLAALDGLDDLVTNSSSDSGSLALFDESGSACELPGLVDASRGAADASFDSSALDSDDEQSGESSQPPTPPPATIRIRKKRKKRRRRTEAEREAILAARRQRKMERAASKIRHYHHYHRRKHKSREERSIEAAERRARARAIELHNKREAKRRRLLREGSRRAAAELGKPRTLRPRISGSAVSESGKRKARRRRRRHRKHVPRAKVAAAKAAEAALAEATAASQTAAATAALARTNTDPAAVSPRTRLRAYLQQSRRGSVSVGMQQPSASSRSLHDDLFDLSDPGSGSISAPWQKKALRAHLRAQAVARVSIPDSLALGPRFTFSASDAAAPDTAGSGRSA
ncbi:uncharacterized protein AMSG_01276 [Thecamonas trahens ATCC 50062]|uniref:Major facilitator superfamily (MFS) profile domain-containing protein n=1 Tax=Thecamonas trahens ATCC 50062 TaxID=461836 RepID=A0A0L0DNJ9_THETB|nr:hypothetical protein AMSG_01276 [Thecamonas trahens ATCC 50062]KNC53566.1 hypothetical protein AMSG_01276 [Thecamonas trahens ATCC 50062]|eukprot:XP_013761883.1 hypothetical protein AMSG_01276 [Thecamonas trahens ATCC 50062]